MLGFGPELRSQKGPFMPFFSMGRRIPGPTKPPGPVVGVAVSRRYSTFPIFFTAVIRRALSASTKRLNSAESR